jgi:hypothetical protein
LTHLIQTPAKELVSGEYYANSKVSKTTTQESYNLAGAERLNNILGDLIND